MNLSRRLEQRIGERGDAAALVWEDQVFGYRDLDAWAATLAAELAARGIDAGDRVAVGLANGPALVAAVLAVLRHGAVLVPLNPAGSADEAGYAVAHSQAALALLGRPQVAAWEPLNVATLVADDPRQTPRRPAASPRPWRQRRDGDAALLMYTSGTTGRPKGVVLSQAALAGNLTTVAAAWRCSQHDRLLLTLPCFHLHGLALGILGSLLAGAAIVLRERFVADEVPALIERHRCTLFFGVPTMYNRLVQLAEAGGVSADLSSMRLWVSGSAPLTGATFEAFERHFGHAILERFGMSEGGFMIAAPYDGRRRPGVVGTALPGIEIRIVDAEKADAGAIVDVADGATGEIVIRGGNLFSGYWRDEAATAAAFVGSWFRSGDLALREGDGMIRIVGRISVDIIKCRGFKISAVEIENCLQAHPEIAEVAVVGVPDADLGEEIVAAVTPRAGSRLSPEQVVEYARAHLSHHKVPGRIVLMPEIPRTGPGKFKKRELVERLRQRG